MRADPPVPAGSDRAAATGDAEIAVSSLFGRIGTELSTLARLAATLQDGLSDCLPAVLAGAGPAMVQVQSIDRMTQVLEDLTRVMSFVAGTVPDDLRLPAGAVLDVVRMTELSRSLAAPITDARSDRAVSDGEVAWL